MSKPTDLARERRIRDHLRDIRSLMNDNPDLARRTRGYLEHAAVSETTIVSLRLPTDLVERIDRLCEEAPALVKPAGGTGRVTRAGAIRLILEQSISHLEQSISHLEREAKS